MSSILIDSSELNETDLLRIACRNGWLSVYCTILIEKYGLDPWSVDAIHTALPLHFACTSGNIELVQYLISQYYDALSHVSDDGLTTMHCAVMGGLAIVKCLVEEHGLKPMLSVDTPRIMLFAYNNWDDELIKYLIVDQGCSIVVNDSTGYSLLHTACKDGALNKVNFLVEECHCNPCVTTKNNETILHLLFTSFYEPKDFEHFFFSSPFSVVNPFALNSFGRTAVDYAIMSRCSVKVLKCLLEGCTLNPTDCANILSVAYHHWSDDVMKYLVVVKQCGSVTNRMTGNTVLHNACRDMDISKLRFLVEECLLFPQCAVNYHNDTLIHAFSSSAWPQPFNFEVLSYLCDECGCNPFQRNSSNFTPLEYLIIHGHEHNAVSIVRHFVEHTQVLLNTSSSRILLLAYQHWNDEMIKYLIVKAGNIINRRNGDSILHRVCRDNNLTRLKFLVQECRCDPNVVNNKRETLLHTVCISENTDLNILSFIVESLVPLHAVILLDHSGLSAFSCAVKNQRLDFIKYFVEQQNEFLNGIDTFKVMCLAYNFGNEAIIKYLILEAQFSIITDKYTGDTLLHKACQKSNCVRLQFLIKDCLCNPSVTNKKQKTILDLLTPANEDIIYFLCKECELTPVEGAKAIKLIIAMQKESKETISMIRYMMSKCGCDLINNVDIMNSACVNWNYDTIKFLIVEIGCNTIVDNDTGDTLLHIACRESNCVRLKFLIKDCLCDPSVTNKKRKTILDILTPANKDVIYFLCKECELTPVEGAKAIKLIIAMQKESKETISMIRYLISKCGCDPINNVDIMNSACVNWNYHAVKFLIVEIGCNIIVDNVTGDTILHKVCIIGTIKMLKFLVNECNCSPHVVNKRGESLLHIVCRYASHKSLLFFRLLSFLCVECDCSPALSHDDISTAFECAIQYEEGLNLVQHLVENYRDYVMFIMPKTFFSFYLCWDQSIMRYLIVEDGFSVIDTSTGDTLLHKACETANLALFYFLLQKCECDPYVVNKKRESILDSIFNSQFLINEHFEMLKYLCEEYKLIFNTLDKSTTVLNNLCISLRPENTIACISCMQAFMKNCKYDIANENWSTTILHQLCSKCHFGPEVVKFVYDLIKDGECDPLTKDSFSSTILHSLLSTTKHYLPHILHFIYFLIDECRIDISSVDVDGNTPLHLACQHFTGNVSVIEHILSTGQADPLLYNKYRETPLMLLDYSRRALTANDKDRVFQLVSRFGEVKLTHPIHSFVNIVLLGDPGVGKSTLTKAIKDRKDVIFGVQFRNVKDVKLLTAGIVPHILNDDDLGSIIIHDLAGHVEYYSSHIAVLENLLQGSAAVFIIVISLADENFLKSFHRWLAIVENVSHNSLYQCQLILAVSHIDQHSRTKLASIESLKQEFSHCLKDTDILYGHGVFGLDCRKLGGNKLSRLISALSTACQSISEANTRETSLYCHMLYDYFQRNKQTVVYTLEDIVHKAEESNELFLPKDIHQLHRIVCTLSSTGLIVFLENQSCLEQSWIIADKSFLVHDLNGVLFAPTTFKQHANIASNTGVVKLSDLLSLFPQYDPELLLRFLQYSELCQIISKDFMTFTNMKPLSQKVAEEANADTYLFVPALIKETGIPEINEPFKFGWCLRCGNLKRHHFFTPRFLHLLLLHLAYKFSESSLNAFEQLCQIWSKGIFWKDLNGAQTLIELTDNNESLIVLVSFQDGPETSVARIINHIREVIVEILTCKQQVMPRTDTTEFILNNSNLLYPLGPLSDLTLFDTRLLAKGHVNGDSFILDTTGDRQVAVAKLFFTDKLSLVQSCCEAVFAGREPKVCSISVITHLTVYTCHLSIVFS